MKEPTRRVTQMKELERDRFLELWERYFGAAELPIAFYYTDDEDRAEAAGAPKGHQCLIGSLARVRRGTALSFHKDALGCPGGKRYLGFARELMPDFEYFLSCGIPDRLEGERYKKSPELVREIMAHAPKFEAPARFIVFKRWDLLDERDTPDAVVFFAKPDVLSGLFTLAGYDEVRPDAVYAPFSAGCGSIVLYPLLEKAQEHPRCVLGMFDVSARPFVLPETLSFAAPMEKFARMVSHMEESFLITPSWEKVKKRI